MTFSEVYQQLWLNYNFYQIRLVFNTTNDLWLIFSELTWPWNRATVLPGIVTLSVNHYQRPSGRISTLEEGLHQVVTNKKHEYIIGVLTGNYGFCRIVIPKGTTPIPLDQLENPDYYQKVQVRIDGMIANVTAPLVISKSIWDFIYNPHDPSHMLPAQIEG